MTTYRDQNTSDRIDYTPGSAVNGGIPTNLGGGLIGYPDRDVAASEKDGFQFSGVRRADCASATTFSIGDTVIYDVSSGLGVPPGLDLDPSVDYEVGICVKAKASGELFVFFVPYPAGVGADRYSLIRPYVYEFVGGAAIGDTDPHILIPAWQNPHGLIVLNFFGIVSEKPVGSSEDQMIITVENTDGTDIGTLTTSATPDEINDIIVGSLDVLDAAAGAAIGAAIVAAGKGVQALVTQQTAGGTPAGKVKVYILAIPLL